ncbi:MAG TPA: hypothetical protein VMW56_05515 [Candidatus Margulisiibacteriota bacterium]|nr:hypothetical protein [Candidatus Margulisiibacteriota bacterium]
MSESLPQANRRSVPGATIVGVVGELGGGGNALWCCVVRIVLQLSVIDARRCDQHATWMRSSAHQLEAREDAGRVSLKTVLTLNVRKCAASAVPIVTWQMMRAVAILVVRNRAPKFFHSFAMRSSSTSDAALLSSS